MFKNVYNPKILFCKHLHFASFAVELQGKNTSVGEPQCEAFGRMMRFFQTYTQGMTYAVTAGHDDGCAFWRCYFVGWLYVFNAVLGVKLPC